MLFHALLLCLLFSCVDPPPTPLCRIITTNPWGQKNAQCICPTRGADEEATIASSQRRRCLQTGLEPLTFTSTSQTGSPHLSSPTWTARMLRLQLDPENSCWRWALVWNICVDSFQRIPSLVNVNVWDSSSTARAAVGAVSRLPKQLGRMGSLHNSSTKPQQWFGSLTITGWISYWNQSCGCWLESVLLISVELL